MSQKKYTTHPSYGQARFSRIMGTFKNLYGSPVAEHHHAIELTISRSEISNDLGRDWRHTRETLIQVLFSPSQFAELITTMNVGDGTACTIDFIQGLGSVPRPPATDQVEHERITAGFEEKLSGLVDLLRDKLSHVRELLAKKSLSKEDRRDIERVVAGTLQEVEKNAPFIVEQFGRATERVVAAAKAEIDESVTSSIQRLGFKKLEELRATDAAEPKQIEVPDVEE